MSHSFTFGGENSLAYGIAVSGSGTFNAPERDVEIITIPGRDGDLIRDNGRFKNIMVTYPAMITRGFAANAQRARAWLLGRHGYLRLTDDYDPNHYRLAAFHGPIDFQTSFLNRAGQCELRFNCKPQRFLIEPLWEKDSPDWMQLPDIDVWTCVNNGSFSAKPLIDIAVNAEGDITICAEAGPMLTITGVEAGTTVHIDCETCNVYTSTESLNAKTSGVFPELPVGAFNIITTGPVGGISMDRRAWTL